MPTCADIRGIKSVDYDKVQEVSVEAVLEESEPLLDSAGDPECQALFKSRNRIQIQGKGALPEAIEAGGTVEVERLEDGVTGVSETVEEQEAGQWHSWNATATNWPVAVPVT